MEMQSEELAGLEPKSPKAAMFDPTMDDSFSSGNLANPNPPPPPPAEQQQLMLSTTPTTTSDTFDSQSQLPPREYYKQRVEELHTAGALEEYRQAQISQMTADFIESSGKDPLSLLNMYRGIAGESFQFYDYELRNRRIDKNKFIMVSELDGRPVFGALKPSKKEAKKSCAVRIIDRLMAEQRFNCVSQAGRRIKHPEKHSRPQPLKTPQEQLGTGGEQQELATLGAEHYQQLPPVTDPGMATFAEDIRLGLDGTPGMDQQPPPAAVLGLQRMKLDFDRQNPVPTGHKDPATFVRVRETAFQLFSENAFWRDLDIGPEVLEKLNECGMWHEKWDPVAFVNKCLVRANSWKKPEMETTKQEEEDTGPGEGEEVKKQEEEEGQNAATAVLLAVVDQERAVLEKERQMQAQPQASLAYFQFTLPYIPPRYVCLALFNDELHFGRLFDSKAKAKTSCATVLAARMVLLGWATLEKKPKTSRRLPSSKAKKRKMAAAAEGESAENTSEANSLVRAGLLEHQFLLTLCPDERLDPRTHFLLATGPSTHPMQLLSQIAGKQRMDIRWEEAETGTEPGKPGQQFSLTAVLHPASIPGLPRDFAGQPFAVKGAPEKSKKAAKSATARAALDQLVRRGLVQVDEKAFANFKSAIKRAGLCECCEDPGEKEEEEEQGQKKTVTIAETVDAGTREALGQY